ncbi:hypothetical protein BZZ01_27180 [Nostocales cyanobacterium HT-58-2]|nr:hypothetical protein BZZ01_27180 [Nostocales cyanobacterium HT-58-2]
MYKFTEITGKIYLIFIFIIFIVMMKISTFYKKIIKFVFLYMYFTIPILMRDNEKYCAVPPIETRQKVRLLFPNQI